MELYDAMSTLRAVRRLRPDPIPEEVLDRVFTAATSWACDCLGRFSSPVTSSTLRCVGFAPPGERLAQTLPVDHRDRQPGSCRSLAGSCSYSRIADLRVLSRF